MKAKQSKAKQNKIKPKAIVKVNEATLVVGDLQAPFSIATTPKCRGRRYAIPGIVPLYS